MKGHYEINDNGYISVTTVISQADDKSGLMQWAVDTAIEYIIDNSYKQLANDGTDNTVYTLDQEILNLSRTYYKDISNEAKTTGTAVHDIIEQHIKSKIAKSKKKVNLRGFSDIEKGCYNAFLKWETDNKVEYIESEKVVHHDSLCYAGTLDILCKLNGKLTYIDIKTSKAFYNDSMGMQLAAYKYADCHMTNYCDDMMSEKENANIGILRLDKETLKYEYKDYSKDFEKYISSFIYLLNFYYKIKNRRIKNDRTRREGIWK
ncbi:MAG: hypothetical protein KKH44_01300 [Bacteroidetes bacterium]|nr:hypothetical protein [Bacteroidota bacterium]